MFICIMIRCNIGGKSHLKHIKLTLKTINYLLHSNRLAEKRTNIKINNYTTETKTETEPVTAGL